MNIADSISKEVQIQDRPTRPTPNLNLSIVQHLRTGFRPSQIVQQINISKTALQYHLNQLKAAGTVRKLGYGVWEVLSEPPKEVQKQPK